jgi:hypothetical protein
VHGRYRVLGGPVPESELRRAESDALDPASGDQHLLADPPDLYGSRSQLVKVRSVPRGPPASVAWCPPGRSMKAVVLAGTATVSEKR